MAEPVKDVYVTTDYGVPGSWAAGHHTGVDYRAAVGTPIYSTHRGRVISVGWVRWGEAYGLHVVIASTGGKDEVVHHGYCHLSSASVSVGEEVGMGERVGLSGATGRTFGAHLHYEERLAPHLYNDRAREPRFPGLTHRMLRRSRRPRNEHPKAKR